MGRDAAIEHLESGLAQARGGGFAAVVVTGAAGMGKTRLVREFLGRAGPRAGTVLTGACPDEGGSLSPFGPVEQVVRQLDDAAGLVHDPAVDVEHRVRAIVEAVREAARRARMVVLVLEDLHWADGTTLEFVAFAAHALVHEPVLLVATHRPGTEVEPALRRLLTTLDRRPRTSRLDLGPLDRADLEELVVERAGGPVDADAVDELVARSGGVTLFVEELAAGLRTGRPATVPQRLRDVVAAQLDPLSLGARELLDWAAVCGQEFAHELLALVADVPAPTLEKRIDEVLDAGLLEVDDTGDGYHFRHALLHEVVRAELRPMVRRRLHAGCARVLRDRPDLVPGDALPRADLARRWSLAQQPGPAFRAFVRAAEEATARAAHGEAARLAATACAWLPRVPADQRGGYRAVAVWRLAAACADRAGDHAEAVARYRRALGTLDVDDPLRAGLLVALLRSSYLAGDIPGAIEVARTPPDELPPDTPDGDRAVLGALSAAFLPPGEVEDGGVPRTTAALELARETGDPGVLCDVLSAHGLAVARSGRPERARRALAEAGRHAAHLSDPRAVLRPPVFEMLVLNGIGATHAVVELGRRTIRRADDLGVARGVGREARLVLAESLATLGRWAEADEVTSAGLAWRDDGLAAILLVLVDVDLAVWRGRFGAAERLLATVQERVPQGYHRLSLARAELAWWQRDHDASRRHAADGLARAGLLADPDEVGRLVVALVRATGPGRSSTGVDDAVALLDARAGHPVADAWRATAVGWAADPDPGRAVEAWEDARAAWGALDRPPMLAMATWRAGLARAAAGDRATAVERLRAAGRLADDLGAVPLAVEARAALAAIGAGPDGDPAAVDPTTDVDVADVDPTGPDTAVADLSGLTAREAEVLGLVARGWTNRRVGEELGISPRTVGTHVSRILDKLGVRTRGEAAAAHHAVVSARPVS